MTRRFFAPAAVVLWIAVVSPSPARADDPSVIFLKALFNRLVAEPAWDYMLGKPDLLTPIQNRLRDVENNTALRSELRDEVRKLREGLNDRVTRDEFRRMAERTTSDIATIQIRLDDLEQRVEKLEVENEDLKNGTKHASSAEHFSERGDRFAAENRVQRALANYNMAVKLDPTLGAAYRGRCGVYERLGAWGVLVAEATEAIERQAKDDHPLWFRRERIVARAKAWGLRPYHADGEQRIPSSDFEPLQEFWKDCAYVLFATKDSDVPILCYSGLAKLEVMYTIRYREHGLNITTEQANELIADLKARRRPWLEQAAADFYNAIRADANCSLAMTGRAIVYSYDFKKKEALAELTKAIRVDPRQKDAYVVRAEITHGLVDKEFDEIEDLKKAHDLDPSDAAITKLLNERTGK
jgi:tetratricopeptide (TPR) repeat protein